MGLTDTGKPVADVEASGAHWQVRVCRCLQTTYKKTAVTESTGATVSAVSMSVVRMRPCLRDALVTKFDATGKRLVELHALGVRTTHASDARPGLTVLLLLDGCG
ncbi:hypothetical protein VFPPC_15671 [Pochonia chlamydosporia 170]|uniref:Uncharacterized protein n=1 Tax=Pochonia chlamydosporia 170 TaxID=1380566 RepID=A0A179G019_METCM|nr:hypothetical protein VFPPC_15671 [Pochonia chlamydosporia 170]OAQ71244.1 hypothetical protein VFPPC_15671 [Pochonia chlamydosporia 170]